MTIFDSPCMAFHEIARSALKYAQKWTNSFHRSCGKKFFILCGLVTFHSYTLVTGSVVSVSIGRPKDQIEFNLYGLMTLLFETYDKNYH